MFGFERNNSKIEEERQEEDVLIFKEKIKDPGFLSKLESSELLKLGRRLMIFGVLLSPELLSQDPSAVEMQKSMQLAKQAEGRIIEFIKPHQEGVFLRKDFKRVDRVKDVEKIFQSGFARTDGKKMQIQESAFKDPVSDEIVGRARYWCDEDMDGRADKMIAIVGETNATEDSIALSLLDKDFNNIVQEKTDDIISQKKHLVYFREGETWKVAEYGKPEVSKLRPEQGIGMQEMFEMTATNVSEKIKKGTTR